MCSNPAQTIYTSPRKKSRWAKKLPMITLQSFACSPWAASLLPKVERGFNYVIAALIVSVAGLAFLWQFAANNVERNAHRPPGNVTTGNEGDLLSAG